MAEVDQAPHAAGAEEIAAQVNPPVPAPAQQPGEIQPAAGAQPVLQANEVRYYFLFWFERYAFGALQVLSLLADICADNACEVCLRGVVFYYFNLMPVRLAAWQNVYRILPVWLAWCGEFV